MIPRSAAAQSGRSVAFRPMASPPVLSTLRLNRALLARQLLLRRRRISALDAVEHLVGMQSQSPRAAYVGLWTRVAGFRPEALERLMLERSVVRVALMRSTIHLVSARDCLALRDLVQPAIARPSRHSAARRAAGVEDDELARAGRALLDAEPRTFRELGALLTRALAGVRRRCARDGRARDRAPRPDPPARALASRRRSLPRRRRDLAQGHRRERDLDGRSRAPLPRGVRPGHASSTLRRSRASRASARCSTAFAPSSRRSATRPAASCSTSPMHRARWDAPALPRGSCPSSTTSCSRTRAASASSRRGRCRSSSLGNGLKPAFLVDGFVAGTWKLRTGRRSAELEVTPFEPLPAAARRELEDEGRRLLAFAARGAERTTITIG